MSADDPAVIERLTRVEVKLDLLLSSRDDQEARLRKVEKWMYVTAGVIGLATGYVGQLLGGI